MAAMTAERRVTRPFPVPPEITPVAVLTLMPAPATGKSLVLVGVNVAALVFDAIPISRNAQAKLILFLVIRQRGSGRLIWIFFTITPE